MKKNLLIPAACLMAASAVLFTACDKTHSDVTRPVIELEDPAEGDTIAIGDEHGIHFDMKVTDDVKLASYKIEIHSNFDNHTHKTSAALRSGEETVAFTFNRSYSLADQREAKIHHHDIKVPANAKPGRYHLMVYCLDAAGNQAVLERNIVLDHDDDHDHDHHHHH